MTVLTILYVAALCAMVVRMHCNAYRDATDAIDRQYMRRITFAYYTTNSVADFREALRANEFFLKSRGAA